MKKLLLLLVLASVAFVGCTTVDSGEIGIKFKKFSGSTESYGGVEGTVKGWVFYWPFTESVFTYPTIVQRKSYEAFTVNARDASTFTMDPMLAYHINPDNLDKQSKEIFNIEIGKICLLTAFTFNRQEE